MDVVTAIQNFIKFVLGLLLALLPLYTTIAQDATGPEKKIRFQYFKMEDGKRVMVDTTLTITDHASLVQGLKGLKVDTAAFRRLSSAKFNSITFDTAPLNTNDKEFRVMRLNGNLTKTEKEELVKKLNRMEGDSIVQELIRTGTLKTAVLDTFTIRRGAQYRRLNASVIASSSTDSVRVFRFERGDSIAHIKPARIERVIVDKTHGDALILRPGKVYGDTTTKREVIVYKLKESKTDQQFKRTEDGEVTIILKRIVTVKDLTTEDVSALKKTGTPVETKPKEELELEQIEYYPNPNDGRFNLRFKPENKGTTVVRVLDSKGQEVFVDTIEKLSGEYEKEIDLRPFGKGLYFLQIAQGKRYHTKKILVR
ncbi:T9SS type A sorting domain-containing protein [Pontibacter cellulosilyticus]|uniref:T9SS type A sorting domain-containing protein n=1 Tax=Pontibacter cellulosilyticus TaxID=1720253 RepID=A0A923N8S3_9BACT|nr:T9SS type A sorting domain-containing protein [Pontibacter cellulosilyticus]MBC5994294.1 T9SS type A sorting domain-containing protein [Pontibacter cellulosilyticus]